MNVISISKKKFAELMPLTLAKEIMNAESTIYDFPYRKERKVFKKIHNLSGPVLTTKLDTIEMLDTYREYLPESFCVPDNLVAIDQTISGFTVPFVEGENLASVLADPNVSIKKQINYLKQIGEILDQLKQMRKSTPVNGLYLNDLHESNFIVDSKSETVRVVDLDSCKIGSNLSMSSRYLVPTALVADAQGKYKRNTNPDASGYIVADENSDLYCYNMMILNYLYGSNVNNMDIADFYDYLTYLSDIGMEPDLINSFRMLLHSCNNRNPAPELDSITKEQFLLAKKKVYRQAR